MDRRSLRKQAGKRVSSFRAFFPDEMQITGAAENDTMNISEEDQNQGDEGQTSQICDSEDDSQSDDDIENVFDARTLLNTTTSYSIQVVAGGTYHYVGILKAFAKSMKRIWFHIPDRHEFKLQLHVDGLPLFNSSSVQFWPILDLLQGVVKKPVVIALFCCVSKPSCLAAYLKDVVSELQELSKAFVIKGKQCFLKVTSVICDSSAKAFIKGAKGHTGYCVQTGVYLKHRMTFPEVNSPLQTDHSFEMMSDEDHLVTKSPLTDVGISIVSCFPHNYMQLVCLGVVRRLLDLWIASGPLLCRLSSHQMELISSALVDLRGFRVQTADKNITIIHKKSTLLQSIS
ncbi:hypothetical protein M9458_055323 [Cirrhinus mrigala]|uniref:Uncharacterized protein n=1 Tax=Cirrhinus mrigala TaxID=683832 RepID=A0ABD0MGB8_CIRMR